MATANWLTTVNGEIQRVIVNDAATRAKNAAYMRKWYRNREWTPEQIERRRTLFRAAKKRYRARHPEAHALEEGRRYRRQRARLMPMQVQRTALRRARLRASPGSFTLQEWLDKCAALGNVCFYCGEARALTRDHMVPLSRGGTNDITNIVPACKPCNSRKHTRTAHEFLLLRSSAA